MTRSKSYNSKRIGPFVRKKKKWQLKLNNLLYYATGNIADDGSRAFEYDAFNRLKTVTEKSGSLLLATYTYDAVLSIPKIPSAKEAWPNRLGLERCEVFKRRSEVTSISRIGKISTEIMDHFAFNVDLDEALFSLEIPKDYTSESLKIDVSELSEKDIVEMLRVWTETTDGEFPSALEIDTMEELHQAEMKKIAHEYNLEQDYSDHLEEVSTEMRESSRETIRDLISMSQKELQLMEEELKKWQKKYEELEIKLRRDESEIEKKAQAEQESLNIQKEILQLSLRVVEKNVESIRRRIEELNKELEEIEKEPEKEPQRVEEKPRIGSKPVDNVLLWVQKQSAVIRGITFVQTLPASSNWFYAGKGVKLGDADRAIFWYRPQGSDAYRVVYGDLSIKVLSEENLPKVSKKAIE